METVMKMTKATLLSAFVLVVVTFIQTSPVLASADFVCVPPPSGLVSWWPGDGDATDIVDANNGVISGAGVTFVAGKVGQAFNFDGTDFVRVPDNNNLEPTQITLDGWIKPNFSGRPPVGADSDIIIEKAELVGCPGCVLNGYILFVAMDSSFPFFESISVDLP